MHFIWGGIGLKGCNTTSCCFCICIASIAHVVQACSPSTCKSGWDFIKLKVESRLIISCNADFWRAAYISGCDGTCQERQTTAVVHFDTTDTLVLYMGNGQISAPQSANMTSVDVFSVCGLLLNQFVCFSLTNV